MTLGEKIKLRRKELNLTMLQLAYLTKVSESLISRIESGETKSISSDKINVFANALKCDIEYLLDLNKQEAKTTEDICDIKPNIKYVQDFILRLANIYKDDVPIKDLKLTLILNGTTINNFELEKYIQQVVQENIELIKHKITKNVLNSINNA